MFLLFNFLYLAPNSYVIKESLTHPHTDVHVSKRIAFGSTAKRLGDKLTSSTKTTAPDNSIPGPAQYSPKRYDEKCSLKGPAEYCIMESESQKGKFVFQSERFKEVVKEQLPGPADYEGVVVRQDYESTHSTDLDDVLPVVHSLQFHRHYEHVAL
ncbi:unnamed protein product [Trichobilharzia regenti]|nr:unnamed protein product [Trichobilharzia regenti]